MEKTPIYVCGDCAAVLVAGHYAERLGADVVPTIGSSQVCEVHPSPLPPNATSAIEAISQNALHVMDKQDLAAVMAAERRAPPDPPPAASGMLGPWSAPVILQLGPKTEIMMRLIAAWSASEKGANADAFAVEHAAMIADQILAHTHGA